MHKIHTPRFPEIGLRFREELGRLCPALLLLSIEKGLQTTICSQDANIDVHALKIECLKRMRTKLHVAIPSPRHEAEAWAHLVLSQPRDQVDS